MPAPLSGPGVGLALPQYLYPTELTNAPIDVSTNRVTLAGGDSIPLPAGDFYVSLGNYLVAQYLDPVSGAWTIASTAGWQGGMTFIRSDGFNWRIANLTGCPVGAEVQVTGSSYVQATTTITPTPGNSTWLPIVGGRLAVVGGTLTSNGAGYGVAPLVLIPAPPPAANNANGVGGIAASAYATIASGTVSGITFTNAGAGYPTAPTAVIVPSPFDPNINVGITAATVAFSLTSSGGITGAICTNSGAPISNPASITLTIAGAGSSGSLTAVVLQTVTNATVSGAGAGYTGPFAFVTVGGAWPTSTFTNSPAALGLAFRPRQGLFTTTSVTANTAPTIVDGGLFAGTPTSFWILPNGGTQATVTLATIALTMGTVPDIAFIQPAP